MEDGWMEFRCFQVIYRWKKTVFVSHVLASHSEFIQSLDWQHSKWIYAPEQWTEIRHICCNRKSNHSLGNYQPVNSFLANHLPVSDHHWFTTIGGKSSEQEDGTSNQDEDPLLKMREHFPLQSGWNSEYDNIKCYIPFSGMNKKMLLKVENNFTAVFDTNQMKCHFLVGLFRFFCHCTKK